MFYTNPRDLNVHSYISSSCDGLHHMICEQNNVITKNSG